MGQHEINHVTSKPQSVTVSAAQIKETILLTNTQSSVGMLPCDPGQGQALVISEIVTVWVKGYFLATTCNRWYKELLIIYRHLCTSTHFLDGHCLLYTTPSGTSR